MFVRKKEKFQAEHFSKLIGLKEKKNGKEGKLFAQKPIKVEQHLSPFY